MSLPGRPDLPTRPATVPVAGVGAGLPAQPAPMAAGTPGHPGTPGAPGQGAGAYLTVGNLTADQLLYGRPDAFDHLQETIVRIRDWMQDHLTSGGRAEEVAEARLDPAKRATMAAELDRLLIQYMSKESVARGNDRNIIMASVINEVLGLGPIEPLWSDNRITEVMVNGPDTIFVEIGGKIVRAPGAKFRDRDHLLEVCQQILMPLNRRVDQKTPLADGRLADGSRVNIVHYAVAPGGPLLTIRRFPETVWTLKDLIHNGSVTADMAAELAWLIYHKASAVVIGGTGSGKALDVTTPIPTPTGFTAMGDLKVGDTVFDEHGKPCSVTGAYDVQHDRPCYEVEFSDGSVIVADAEHLWLTETRSARRARSRIRTMERTRNAVLTADEAAVLRAFAVTSDPDAVISVPQIADLLGWNADRRSSIYRVAKTLTPVVPVGGGDVITKVRLGYRTHELVAALLDRWTQPWHDQRAKSATAAVVNTAEIRATLRTSQGHANHSIPVVTGAVQGSEKDLPVDPYLLGLWLGDGCTTKAKIATEDAEIVEALQSSGYRVTRYSDDRCNYGVAGGFKAALRTAGVLGHKHIPTAYLTASERQRRALLAGLLDTDGGVSEGGSVEFYNSDETLARQVRSLVASLGYQARIRRKEAYLNGKRHKDTYTVAFTSRDLMFGLARKQTALESATTRPTQADRARQRYIVEVRPVESRPVRCIRVNSASRLFLAGDQYIPTHNTSLLNALSSCIPRDERVITVEDSLELRLHPDAHVAAMEARPASANDSGEVRIRDLVKNALRMRPDRIVVGEVRDACALDMLQAMNTGHEGSMTTVHANGAEEALNRLAVLVAQGGEIPEDKVHWLIGDAVDLLIVQRRFEDGSRRIGAIYEVPSMKQSREGRLQPIPLWVWEQTGIDDAGKFLGEYRKVNDISEELMALRRLGQFQKFTVEDVYRMSELPAHMQKGS